MIRWTRVLFLAFALGLPGCASVFVTEPVGDAPMVITAEEWQGTWVSGEAVLMTTVLDAGAGVLQAAWLERDEDGARLEVFRGEVRRSGDWVFISMPAPHSSGEAVPAAVDAAADGGSASEDAVPEYLWGRVHNDGRTALVWWPRPEAFRDAVRDGRMPGIVKEDDDVRLGGLTADHLQRINDPGSGLLGWEEPLVFIRIGE